MKLIMGSMSFTASRKVSAASTWNESLVSALQMQIHDMERFLLKKPKNESSNY